MVGFIITGHGNFASGLYSACKMLIGERENIEVVDYIDSEKVYDLDKRLAVLYQIFMVNVKDNYIL